MTWEQPRGDETYPYCVLAVTLEVLSPRDTARTVLIKLKPLSRPGFGALGSLGQPVAPPRVSRVWGQHRLWVAATDVTEFHIAWSVFRTMCAQGFLTTAPPLPSSHFLEPAFRAGLILQAGRQEILFFCIHPAVA